MYTHIWAIHCQNPCMNEKCTFDFGNWLLSDFFISNYMLKYSSYFIWIPRNIYSNKFYRCKFYIPICWVIPCPNFESPFGWFGGNILFQMMPSLERDHGLINCQLTVGSVPLVECLRCSEAARLCSKDHGLAHCKQASGCWQQCEGIGSVSWTDALTSPWQYHQHMGGHLMTTMSQDQAAHVNPSKCSCQKKSYFICMGWLPSDITSSQLFLPLFGIQISLLGYPVDKSRFQL